MLNLKKLKVSILVISSIIILNIGMVLAANTKDVSQKSETDLNVRKPPLSAKNFTDVAYKGKNSGFINIDANNWNKVKSINGLFGIVYNDLLNSDLMENAYRGKIEEEQMALIKKEAEANKFVEKDAWINAVNLYVRVNLSIQEKAVDKVTKGDKVHLINETKDANGVYWYQLKTANSKIGWVYKKYVSLTQVSSTTTSTSTSTNSTSNGSDPVSSNFTGADVVSYAKNYVGYKYVYGGTTPSGFDCSGFVNYVYKHFGISMSRSSYDIAVEGQAVTYANLMPGDVLCFQRDGKVGHVGIYIGDGKMVHAQSADTGVVISSVAPGSSHYSRFKCGRRFIK